MMTVSAETLLRRLCGRRITDVMLVFLKDDSILSMTIPTKIQALHVGKLFWHPLVERRYALLKKQKRA
jgi:hypothetical protein